MDVPPPPAPGADVVTAAPLTPQAPAPAPAAASGAPAVPGTPAPAVPGAPQAGLAPAIAKIFGGGHIPLPVGLHVSYRVVKDPNEIVTVFTDPRTGQEIAQFPPEVIIGLAEFFDQQQGATLDRSA